MYYLRVKDEFAAAHKLPQFEKCAEVHGHTYEVEVVLEAEELDENGVVMDLSVAKKVLREELPDHPGGLLNDVFIENPTCELLAEEIFKRVQSRLSVKVGEVTVWESDRGGATFRPKSDEEIVVAYGDVEPAKYRRCGDGVLCGMCKRRGNAAGCGEYVPVAFVTGGGGGPVV